MLFAFIVLKAQEASAPAWNDGVRVHRSIDRVPATVATINKGNGYQKCSR